MNNKKTYKDVLIYGINHIAENHNIRPILEDIDYGQVAVLGNNIPTLADIQSLCDDLEIPRYCIHTTMFGIDIDIPSEWFKKKAKKVFKNKMCFWEKCH